MAGVIDSHCHMDVEAFDGDREPTLARAREAGLVGMIVPGITPADMPRVLALAEAHPDMVAAVGIHPHEVATWDDAMPDRLRAWASHPKVVAIGEIGLDYYYDHPRDQQQAMFRAQLRLAREVSKPVIIHDRDAHGDVLQAIEEELDPAIGGVMHCFSGSAEFAMACVRAGMFISFAGPVTYKNAHNLHEAAGRVPIDRLLIETDSPYLAPVPHRGKRNEPAHVVHVAAKLAELHGVSLDEMAAHTLANTRRLFRLPG